MKLFDIEGNYVTVDVRPSSWPMKGISKSKLQKKVGEYLLETYISDSILEEFIIPGSKLSVDFFIPRRKLIIEIQGRQHDEFTPHFHGQIGEHKFARQISHDRRKAEWAEMNGFKIIEIRTEADLEQLNNA